MKSIIVIIVVYGHSLVMRPRHVIRLKDHKWISVICAIACVLASSGRLCRTLLCNKINDNKKIALSHKFQLINKSWRMEKRNESHAISASSALIIHRMLPVLLGLIYIHQSVAQRKPSEHAIHLLHSKSLLNPKLRIAMSSLAKPKHSSLHCETYDFAKLCAQQHFLIVSRITTCTSIEQK